MYKMLIYPRGQNIHDFQNEFENRTQRRMLLIYGFLFAWYSPNLRLYLLSMFLSNILHVGF